MTDDTLPITAAQRADALAVQLADVRAELERVTAELAYAQQINRTLVDDFQRVTAERDQLAAQVAAIDGAAEELSHWPEMAERPFVALLEGKQYALRPEQVVGVYEGWCDHVKRLAPYGDQVVRERAALRARLGEARTLITRMLPPYEDWNRHAGYGGFYSDDIVAAKEARAFLAQEDTPHDTD